MKPNLLDVLASANFMPANLNEYESEARGWTEYIDRHVPGWIITKYSPRNKRDLTFKVGVCISYTVAIVKCVSLA